MSMSLPIELQLEIFSYLPCKTIIRFMVLSHLHHSLLISPDFISRHHSKSRKKLFVLLLPSITNLCEDDDHLTLFQNLFVHRNFGDNIIGICDGIICMQTYRDVFFINPMIRYCFDLPLHKDKSIYYSYGFISRGLSDYLVVKIDLDAKHYYYADDDEGEYIPSPRKAWFYTYVKHDWRPLKILDCSLLTPDKSLAYNGVVYNGLLHWGAKKWVENALGMRLYRICVGDGYIWDN
ncbi:F-box protein At5g18160-like [Phaseolus vulgaris]|uniref:F-box protein At5g18160-like n=1 Tax=Phaseolus vulgaris TaxID=3885 RepID=UPI0035CB9725